MYDLDRIIRLALAAGLTVPLLWACAPATQTPAPIKPASIEMNEETGLGLVRLTEAAAMRIGLATSNIRMAAQTRNGTSQLAVPYSSVLYDTNGDTWIYVSPETLAFVRRQIDVDYIEGDTAVLLTGPDAETIVVTVGAAELYGGETGIGK